MRILHSAVCMMLIALMLIQPVTAADAFSTEAVAKNASVDSVLKVNPDITEEQAAERLYYLGLMSGIGVKDGIINFALDRPLTNLECIIMVIRLIGAESDVLQNEYVHSFTDVPAWGSAYVGYFVHRGILSSDGELFGPDDPVSTAVFMKYMLNALGHASNGSNYSLADTVIIGQHIGICTEITNAVTRGQAALTIEQRAFGERGGTPKGPACQQPAMQTLMLGRTLIGERCRDVSRTIDVIEAHFPMIDASRIALMGNSGGGTTTIYAAALDERIAAAMPSCAFCGYRESIGELFHCVCNYVPNIMNEFDMGDLGGLIAPRPLIVVNGLKDGIFPIQSAKEQMEITKDLYADANAADMVRHVIGAEGHRFYAADAWPVFDELTGWKK